MTTEEMRSVKELMLQGLGYRRIAALTGLSADTVKSYCRRHNDHPQIFSTDLAHCLNCGKTITQIPHHRPRKYCSDSCRMLYWNSHRDLVQNKKQSTMLCQLCGKEFISPGNSNRKYCSRECADSARRKGVIKIGD